MDPRGVNNFVKRGALWYNNGNGDWQVFWSRQATCGVNLFKGTSILGGEMKAIDVHCHVSIPEGQNVISPEDADMMEKQFGHRPLVRSKEEMAQDLRGCDIKCLIIPWDAESNTGIPRFSNESVMKLVKEYPDVYLGAWAMIDPWKGKMAIQELERAVKELGMIGLKFQGVGQGFFPNDRRFYPLYEKCVELKVPVMFHTGSSMTGAGQPGGGGLRLKYTQPIHLDDVAADFPRLTIIAAHMGWPWIYELYAILLHKINVFCELSSTNPRYYPPEFKREINSRLQDTIM